VLAAIGSARCRYIFPMAPSDLLPTAQSQFLGTLELVGDGDWDRPTPCDAWRVRDLVAHLVSGEHMVVALLDGASTDEARALIGSVRTDGDLRAALSSAFAASRAAFDAPGSLERTVHHPVGDISGSQLRDFRVGDATLHAWDLARAIGADESLDPALVDAVWTQLEPLSAVIGSIGLFGDGPSGALGADDGPQRRLLDLTGRRP
jgi:uncharacterized protein (TIGR03086 family)